MQATQQSLAQALAVINTQIKSELDQALIRLEAARKALATERENVKLAEFRQREGLKQVRALMRQHKLSVQDLA